MSVPIGVFHHDQDSRPVLLQRARSHSSPSRSQIVPPSYTSRELRPARPQHARAPSPLGSGPTLPTDASKPESSLERAEKLATGTLHRLHLPGRNHTHRESLDGDASRRRSKLHRYTQSLADQHHHTNSHAHHNAATMHATRMKRRADLNADSTAHDSLPNLVAGLNAERNRAHYRSNASSADTQPSASTASSSLNRVMSNRSYRGLAAGEALHHVHDPTLQRPYDLRRRATSDPRAPNYDSLGNPVLRPKTSIELDLERADRVARQRRFTLTAADIRAKDAQIRAAEDELRESLQQISHRGMEITRRLDYGFYNLLEKVGNLASVIHSFQSLEKQSRQLITNLESESAKTDEQIRHRTKKLQEGFDERETRIVALEERQREVQRRAKELGDRLERARNRVERWEKRESERQEVWGRFWERVWWTLAGVVVLVVAAVLARIAYRAGDSDAVNPVATLSTEDRQGAPAAPAAAAVDKIHARLNKTDEQVKMAMERVPDDVKSVLVEITQRQTQQQQQQQQWRPQQHTDDSLPTDATTKQRHEQEKEKPEPAPLRVLDEL